MGLVPIFFCFGLTRQTVANAKLEALIAPLVTDLGLEFVGLEFGTQPGGSVLRVYIDAVDRPVTVDDCERASREISALLDVEDPISGHYTLEVSSPGLERPLFTPEHFRRFTGQVAKITLALPVDGRRRYQGTILSAQEAAVSVDQDGTPVSLAYANIERARLVPDYVALGLAPAPRKDGKPGRGRPASNKVK